MIMFIDLSACYNFVWVLYRFIYGNAELNYSPGTSRDLVFGWRTLHQGADPFPALGLEPERAEEQSLSNFGSLSAGPLLYKFVRPSKSLWLSSWVYSVFTYSINASKFALWHVVNHLLRVFYLKKRRRRKENICTLFPDEDRLSKRKSIGETISLQVEVESRNSPEKEEVKAKSIYNSFMI